MTLRFVVVPAIPTETGSTRNGVRFYSQTSPIGLNIYDNKEKLCLKSTYSTQLEAKKSVSGSMLSHYKLTLQSSVHMCVIHIYLIFCSYKALGATAWS